MTTGRESLPEFRQWLADRRERIAWAKLIEDTRELWEPVGFGVYVDTNAQRIVITKRDTRGRSNV